LNKTYLDSNLPSPPDMPVKNSFELKKISVYFIVSGIFIVFFYKAGVFDSVLNAGWFKIFAHFFIFRGIFLFVLFPFFISGFIKYLKYRNIVSDLPTSKIRSASMGMVELKGVARRKYNLLSPCANLPCIYYRVNKYKRANKTEQSGWAWYETSVSGNVPFYLEDDYGRVCVYPEGADIFPLKKETYTNTGGFYTHGIPYMVPAGQKWEEEVILDNSPLYVLGWAEYPLQSDKSEIKKIRLEILRKIKKDEKLLSFYDEDKNGRIDPHEWEKAVSDADRKAYKKYLSEPDRKKESFIVLDPPYKGFPMIIAPTRLEDKILKKFSFYMWLNLLGAVAAFVAGSIMFFTN
jgi:hypothetical protein